MNQSYSPPNKPLQSEEQRVAQLQDSRIPNADANRYAKIFHNNRFTNETLIDLTKSGLLDLRINVLGDIKIILRLGQPRPIATKTTAPTTQPSEHMPSTIFMKAPAA